MTERQEGLQYDDEIVDPDAAPVAAVAYQGRRKWLPAKNAVGFITNSERPVARVRWPKARARKDFFARLRKQP